MRFRLAVVLLYLFFAPELLSGAFGTYGGPPARHGGDNASVLGFMRGIFLSYAGQHAEAQKEFEAYREKHPDDLLVYLRMGYDRFLGKPSAQISPEEYRSLIALVSEAIAKYEKIGCSGTDIQSVAGTTLDCPYVGAALYSLRLTLVGKSDSWRKVGKDRDKFLLNAKQSRSRQALFLLGLYEYEPSRQWPPLRFMLRNFAKVPTNHDRAVATILRSLEGEPDPFRDDIWLFIFDVECACDGRGGPPDEAFLKKYPLKDLVNYLRAKYPESPKLKGYKAR